MSSPQILIDLFVTEINQQMGDRIIATYVLGSLGEHGDFSLCSDVDVAILLDKIKSGDEQQINAVWERLKKSGLDYADRLSVFWSSLASNDFSSGQGRFPALDRLDFIRHAKLLSGDDRRNELSIPTQNELIHESARFIFSHLFASDKFNELTTNTKVILDQGARYFSKSVLFPVRLLFTLANELTIASNKDALNYFEQHWHNKVSESTLNALRCAYQARELPADMVVDFDPQTLRTALHELYLLCLKNYLAAVKKLDDTELTTKLEKTITHFKAVID